MSFVWSSNHLQKNTANASKDASRLISLEFVQHNLGAVLTLASNLQSLLSELVLEL